MRYISASWDYFVKILQDHNILKALIALPIFVHNYVVGGCDIVILKGILVLYLVDFITGFAVAVMQKRVSSFRFLKGALKLGVYMVLLFIARFFDQTFHLPDIVLGFMYAFLIGTDSISILENLSKLGFNVPIRLVKYLEVFIEKKERNLKDMLEK